MLIKKCKKRILTAPAVKGLSPAVTCMPHKATFNKIHQMKTCIMHPNTNCPSFYFKYYRLYLQSTSISVGCFSLISESILDLCKYSDAYHKNFVKLERVLQKLDHLTCNRISRLKLNEINVFIQERHISKLLQSCLTFKLQNIFS